MRPVRYAAMRRSALFLFVAALTAPIVLAQPAMAAKQAQLIRMPGNTSTWSPPSPDPTGITYNPKKHVFMISDSEVDETGLWHHRNLFTAGRRGGLIRTGRVTKATVEPEAIEWDARSRSLYVSDDDLDAVFRFKPGRDGRIGTPDDVVRKLLNTRRFGSDDPEGLDFIAK